MIDGKNPSLNAPGYSAQTWAVSTSCCSHLWCVTVNLGTKLVNQKAILLPGVKSSQYEGKEGKMQSPKELN